MSGTARGCAILIALALAGSAATARAQEGTASSAGHSLAAGSRVRLLVGPEPVELQGVVLNVDDKNLTLAPDARVPVKVRLDAIERLEVSVGRKRNALRGLVIGGVSMGLLGLTFSVDPEDCGSDSANFCSRAEAVGAGALTGALLGSVIGGLIQTEQWMPLGVEVQRPTLTGNRNGAAEVALSFAF